MNSDMTGLALSLFFLYSFLLHRVCFCVFSAVGISHTVMDSCLILFAVSDVPCCATSPPPPPQTFP